MIVETWMCSLVPYVFQHIINGINVLFFYDYNSIYRFWYFYQKIGLHPETNWQNLSWAFNEIIREIGLVE